MPEEPARTHDADDRAGRDRAGRWRLLEFAPRLARLENAALRNLSPPLTFGQYRILRRVAEGQATLTELGGDGTLSLAAISESVDALVRKRALQRETDRRDRRSMRLSLTSEGQRLLDDGGTLLDGIAERLCGDLSEPRTRQFLDDVGVVDELVIEQLRGGGASPAGDPG